MEKIILTLFSFLPDHEKHFNIFEGKKISEKDTNNGLRKNISAAVQHGGC